MQKEYMNMLIALMELELVNIKVCYNHIPEKREKALDLLEESCDLMIKVLDEEMC
jgi:hypothetical protein